jgi:hypothetical protein
MQEREATARNKRTRGSQTLGKNARTEGSWERHSNSEAYTRVTLGRGAEFKDPKVFYNYRERPAHDGNVGIIIERVKRTTLRIGPSAHDAATEPVGLPAYTEYRNPVGKRCHASQFCQPPELKITRRGVVEPVDLKIVCKATKYTANL